MHISLISLCYPKHTLSIFCKINCLISDLCVHTVADTHFRTKLSLMAVRRVSYVWICALLCPFYAAVIYNFLLNCIILISVFAVLYIWLSQYKVAQSAHLHNLCDETLKAIYTSLLSNDICFLEDYVLTSFASTVILFSSPSWAHVLNVIYCFQIYCD